ncbi:hypothetical protein ABW20_dc0106490 [Dactylellina cionopaga]|nr:hypothetical protein ABW20_dc0106490 [Dactylellina cionopaga]
MHLTEPELHDPSDPLIIYDAYAISEIVLSTFDPQISQLAHLQYGSSNQNILEKQVSGWAKKMRDEADKQCANPPDGNDQIPNENKKKKRYHRFVIRDTDIEVSLAEWRGALFENGGISDEEREDLRERLKGRGKVIAFTEWFLQDENWYKTHLEQEKEEERKRREREEEGSEQKSVLGGNPDLRTAFHEKIMALRKKLVEDKEHFRTDKSQDLLLCFTSSPRITTNNQSHDQYAETFTRCHRTIDKELGRN